MVDEGVRNLRHNFPYWRGIPSCRGSLEHGTGQCALDYRRADHTGLVFFLPLLGIPFPAIATLIIINLPFALIGGAVSQWLSGQYLSVLASIGFVELFGVAVGNGIVAVSYINQLRTKGGRSTKQSWPVAVFIFAWS